MFFWGAHLSSTWNSKQPTGATTWRSFQATWASKRVATNGPALGVVKTSRFTDKDFQNKTEIVLCFIQHHITWEILQCWVTFLVKLEEKKLCGERFEFGIEGCLPKYPFNGEIPIFHTPKHLTSGWIRSWMGEPSTPKHFPPREKENHLQKCLFGGICYFPGGYQFKPNPKIPSIHSYPWNFTVETREWWQCFCWEKQFDQWIEMWIFPPSNWPMFHWNSANWFARFYPTYQSFLTLRWNSPKPIP